MVTAQSLLHGAVYSLEQCGLLLRDARLLYDKGSYATALAVAAFAREELGRWLLLLELRTQVVAGKRLSVKDVETKCDNHVRKQEAGMTSLTLRADRNSGVGKLLESRMKASPNSKERREADKQIEKIDQLKRKRIPDDRHRLRMKALYVDLQSEEQWSRPVQEISQTTAYNFLVDATNDYGLQRTQRYLELEFLKHTDPDLHDALVRWSDRPELLHVDMLIQPPTDPSP
jgi:AbiV family abortive infection protein